MLANRPLALSQARHNRRIRGGGCSVICVICRVVATAAAETTLITSSTAERPAEAFSLFSVAAGVAMLAAGARAPPPRNPWNRYRIVSSANADRSSRSTDLTQTPRKWACFEKPDTANGNRPRGSNPLSFRAGYLTRSRAFFPCQMSLPASSGGATSAMRARGDEIEVGEGRSKGLERNGRAGNGTSSQLLGERDDS